FKHINLSSRKNIGWILQMNEFSEVIKTCLNPLFKLCSTDTKKPQIYGRATVMEGDDVNLACSVDSFPPSVIKWTKSRTETYRTNNILRKADNSRVTYLQEKSGNVSFSIINITAEEAGPYISTYMNKTVAEHVDIQVTWFAKILKGSGCLLRSDVLTCVCISEGFPLPTIKWPLLKDHTEYSVINMVSNHTVNSTVTVTIETHGNISVECSSSNQNGEAKEKLTVQSEKPNEEDPG
uniref:Ig-like domain-containing protein n=1 Tax=Fundulus heteroclitus TaxID=8078 RepID=A0A3Q2P3K2_FUNHE